MQYFEVHFVEDIRDESGFSMVFEDEDLKIKNYSYAHLDEIKDSLKLIDYDISAINFGRRITKKEYEEMKN